MSLTKLHELKQMKSPKDLGRAVVKIKGFRSSSRVIHAKFAAAQGAPLVVLSLSEIRAHAFSITTTARSHDDGLGPKVCHELWCDSLLVGQDSQKSSYLLAQFDCPERAAQGLVALEKALASRPNLWFTVGLLALVWVVLFMPMPRNQSPVAQTVSPPSLGMGARMPAGGGLLVPSIGSLAMPGTLGSPGPQALAAASQPEPVLSGLPEARAVATSPGSGLPLGSEDDPFGLKISPNGSGVPVKR